MTVAAPLTFPLAGLLAEPPGTTRAWEVHGVTIPLPDDLRLVDPIEGTVEVARTNRGVLVRAGLRTAIAGTCARCLRDIEVPIEIELDEEALPSVDLASGAPLDLSAEPDVARLTAHHELALGPLVGDAISLAEPIAPLCEATCPGLCPTCGERLGPSHAVHVEDAIDPRLEALRGFRVDAGDESE
ncbi:MAG: YceD family protein [Candidatus Limnocylindrales bacterium]